MSSMSGITVHPGVPAGRPPVPPVPPGPPSAPPPSVDPDVPPVLVEPAEPPVLAVEPEAPPVLAVEPEAPPVPEFMDPEEPPVLVDGAPASFALLLFDEHAATTLAIAAAGINAPRHVRATRVRFEPSFDGVRRVGFNEARG
jgi:hypothetical protein